MANLNPSYGVPFTMKSGTETPKEVMNRIIESHPGKIPHDIYKIFAEEVINDPELNVACLTQLAVNLYTSIDRLKMDPAERRKIERRRKEEKADLLKEAKKMVARVRDSFILDTIMPNQKTARDCTGAYLVKHGGALAKIGAMVKPQQIVGQHITDKKAQAVLGG